MPFVGRRSRIPGMLCLHPDESGWFSNEDSMERIHGVIVYSLDLFFGTEIFLALAFLPRPTPHRIGVIVVHIPVCRYTP